MKIFSLFLLLGVIAGLGAQPPVTALAVPMAAMKMAAMTGSDMAAMPDCMAAMQKDAKHAPCNCDKPGCIAMMTSATAIMLPAGSAIIGASATSARDELVGNFPALLGRSIAPEPEPPSPLI